MLCANTFPCRMACCAVGGVILPGWVTSGTAAASPAENTSGWPGTRRSVCTFSRPFSVGRPSFSINGAPVDGRFPEQLPPILNIIASLPVGAKVKLVVKRGEQTTTPELVTEKLESRQGEEWAFEKWGLTVRKVSRAYARENQLDDDTGLLVIGVQPGFPAAVAGLDRGDIITKINQERVSSLEVAKKLHEAFVAKPAPTLIEAESDRRVSLYILKP